MRRATMSFEDRREALRSRMAEKATDQVISKKAGRDNQEASLKSSIVFK